MQQIVLTAAQRESLIGPIAYAILSTNNNLGLGETGEVWDMAAQIVDKWAEDNNIIFE